MRALLLLAAVPTAAFAPISALDLDRARDVTIQPGAVRVQLESGDVLAFLLGNDVVTQIDLRVRGVDYSVPLECAGGLRDVKFDSAVLSFESTEVGIADRSFSLLFDVGQPVYDRMPRIQLGFYRRRLTQMIRMEPMGETGGALTKLCEELPAGPVTCEDTRELTGLDPYTLVQQLRDFPGGLPAGVTFDPKERTRRRIYEDLLASGAESVPPLAAALRDSDARLRRQAALALLVLGGGWYSFECGTATLDIVPALPALIAAFRDSDTYVRAWSAQAVGGIGPNAAAAVPALVRLLRGDEGARNSAALALGEIGAPAAAALPALRRAAAADRSENVRKFAARAIALIEQTPAERPD